MYYKCTISVLKCTVKVLKCTKNVIKMLAATKWFL